MLIANPIYDVVFKYLMEDSKVAKLLIGSIIGCEILELEFRPIIRRLQQAVEVPEIRDNMEAEDTYLEELESRERRALNAEKLLQEARLQIAQSVRRMRQAGLSDADICTFLNISTAELSQMTSFSNDE